MRKLALLVSAIVALVPFAALAHSYSARTIEIIHPWTYEHAKAGESEATIYVTIRNKGKSADRLTGVAASGGAQAEIRGAPAAKDGKGGLVIPAGQKVELGREGPHIVVTGIKKTLVAYDSVELTLIFARAGKVKIEAMAEELPAAPAPGAASPK